MLYLYSDCSRQPSGVSVTAIVLTSRTFIGYDARVLYDVRESVQGELRAVIMGMEMIDRDFDTPQVIKIHCDCSSIVDLLEITLREETIPRVRKYRDEWVKLYGLCKKHTVLVTHVSAHKTKRNCNVVCDLGARALL